MIYLRLFTTQGCHLCEQAQAMLAQLPTEQELLLCEVEIGDDDALTEQYGIRIPVLQLPDETELNWPFSQQDVLNALHIS